MDERKRSLRKEIVRLALPIALQQFMTALVGACDAIMLGKLSQDAMSAVSLATQVTFVFNLFMFAFMAGENMFVAQYYGKGDYTGISQVFSLVTKICGCIAVVFLAGTLFFPEQLMRILTNEETLIVLGSEYLRVIGISYVFSGIAQIFLAIMKNCGAVNMSTLINGVMVILNIALNAVFIFGLSGFPKMGIKGAALATVLATVMQFLWSVGYVLCRIRAVQFSLRSCEKKLFGRFWQKAVPLLINNLAWGIGFSMYSVIMGHLGTDAVAANGIANISKNLVVCFCLGLGNAGSNSGKPSWCRPPARSKRGRRDTYQKCDYCRNCIRPCPDCLITIYHKNGRSHPDSPRISAKNAADLFLLHRRKISKLYDNRRNLRSRRRLQIWNAV